MTSLISKEMSKKYNVHVIEIELNYYQYFCQMINTVSDEENVFPSTTEAMEETRPQWTDDPQPEWSIIPTIRKNQKIFRNP